MVNFVEGKYLRIIVILIVIIQICRRKNILNFNFVIVCNFLKKYLRFFAKRFWIRRKNVY